MSIYRVYTTREEEMAGAGLGTAEMYGDECRDFFTREAAESHAAHLSESGSDDLRGTYRVRTLDGWEATEAGLNIAYSLLPGGDRTPNDNEMDV